MSLEPPVNGTISASSSFRRRRGGGFDRAASFARWAPATTWTGRFAASGMHRTDTVDTPCAVGGNLALRTRRDADAAGDTLVQRGTNHAWSTGAVSPLCLVLVSAAPLRQERGAKRSSAQEAAPARLAIGAVPKATARPRRKHDLVDEAAISGASIEPRRPSVVKPLPGAPRSATGANIVPMKSTRPSGSGGTCRCLAGQLVRSR